MQIFIELILRLDDLSCLKLILYSDVLEYIVINLVLLQDIVRFMLNTTAW